MKSSTVLALLFIYGTSYSQNNEKLIVSEITNTLISLTASPVSAETQLDQVNFVQTFDESDSLNTTYNFDINLKNRNITLKNPFNGDMMFSINYSYVSDMNVQEGVDHDLNFHFNDKIITEHGQVLGIRYVITKNSSYDIIYILFAKDEVTKSRQLFKVTKPVFK